MVTRISFSYSEELKKKLQMLAKNDKRSLSSYIQKILSDHVAEELPLPVRKKKTKKIKRQ